MWEWLLKECRPVDFFLLAGILFNGWRIRFIVKWINGGCNRGEKKKKS